MTASPSEISIQKEGSDITSEAVIAETRFSSMAAAQPGSGTVTMRDRERAFSAVVGEEVTLDIDSQRLWGGYVTAPKWGFFFPAVDTSSLSKVTQRKPVLSLVDYNIIFDKRVLHNDADLLHQIPNFSSEDLDGALIRAALDSSTYIDVPSGWDVSSQIDDVACVGSYQTFLNGAITAGATSCVVDSVDGFPFPAFPPDFYAVIKDAKNDSTNREIVKVTAQSGTTLTITRAQQSTSAVAHGDGSFLVALAAAGGAWPQQSTKWRDMMDSFALLSGAVWYARGVTGGGVEVVYKALETVLAPWGFSDVPGLAATDDPSLDWIGFRELDATENGESLANDALIWGGSEFAGSGQTVFYRATDTSSITDHRRWQVGETHFGDQWYKLPSGVAARAKTIVFGDPGVVPGSPYSDSSAGLRYTQWNLKLSWFADRVPTSGGVPQHIRCGDVLTFRFYTLGEGGSPLVLVLPLRQLDIEFPSKPKDPNVTWVKFTGTFSLQLTDPKTLWTFLRKVQKQASSVRPVIATTDGSSGQAVYGTYFSGPTDETPDGSATVFHLQGSLGYISGTTRVYIGGALQIPGSDYTESDPNAGEITFSSAPGASDEIWIQARLTG